MEGIKAVFEKNFRLRYAGEERTQTPVPSRTVAKADVSASVAAAAKIAPQRRLTAA